jgi:hypothetical protein
MDMDDRLRDLDRAQLLKLGTAALLAATAGALTEGEADAAAHAMGRNTGHPLTLDYQVQGFGVHPTMQHTRLGKELKRVRITAYKPNTHGAAIVHELDSAEVRGTDEDGRTHNRQFGRTMPIYVALWLE